MIQSSRRRFLKVVLVAAVGAATVGIVAVRFPYDALHEQFYRLSDDTPLGQVNGEVMRTLMAATDALIVVPFERRHYEDFFSWYAANVPGYRDLYERMAAMLDRMAMKKAQKPFADLEFEARRGIVDELLQLRERRVYKLLAGFFIRDRLLFDRDIAQPVLDLYSRTDAWIHLGYDAWQGQPRGLDNYRRAPVKAARASAGRRRA